ncbi:MAG: DUF1015 domain-containing protein [Acidobacteriota bacterium]|nr:DUF1015 domain-containing protein [Acidobacteriota bacterium]
MAEIEPLYALHYDLATAGALGDLVAPPYDVIDAALRAQLAARSPNNVVNVDLPAVQDDADPYAAAGARFEQWQRDGVIVRDAQPAIWAHEQDYVGPDGVARTRRGFFCRVRIEEYGPGRVRPHERTHPGPKEDRLRLTRATRCNLSPIFSLYSDPDAAAWSALGPHIAAEPFGTARDGEGTEHRLWRVDDQGAIEAVIAATAGAELLIADGHHRYETAQAYSREIGQTDTSPVTPPHGYVLMCLVALEDPGLTVFPTHRLAGGLDAERSEALCRAIERDFEGREVSEDELVQLTAAPPGGAFEMGFVDRAHERPRWLTLKDQSVADAALDGHSDSYKHLDTGVLEGLILKGTLGLGDDDISHLNGFGYARHPADAIRCVRDGAFDAAFLMRPTPVAQIRDIAAAGENMPPKSTFFYPKLLTGLLFNPLY